MFETAESSSIRNMHEQRYLANFHKTLDDESHILSSSCQMPSELVRAHDNTRFRTEIAQLLANEPSNTSSHGNYMVCHDVFLRKVLRQSITEDCGILLHRRSCSHCRSDNATHITSGSDLITALISPRERFADQKRSASDGPHALVYEMTTSASPHREHPNR